MIFYFFLWCLGLVFTLVKGKLVGLTGSEVFVPDLLTIAAAYLFLSFSPTVSCVFALSQGFFIDLYSGGMHGLFTLLYLSVFCTVWLGSRFFDLQTSKGQVFIVLLAMLSKTIFFVLMVVAVSQSIFFPKAFLWVLSVLVLVTGLLSPIVFFMLERLKNRIFEDREKGLFGQL